MTVIMVLLTFAIFLSIDYVRGHKQLARQSDAQPTRRPSVSQVVPAFVAGFEVPENVRFHAGHTWALAESRELVRVGMDDFASKLVGKIESITLPQRGRWCSSAGRSSVVRISPRKNQVPSFESMSIVLLPCHPTPASAA